MQPTIQYDQEFRNKLRNINKNKSSDKITLKCKYPEYYDIIFKNTFLPSTLINLICEWVDDEIILNIRYDCGYLDIKLKDTYINFIDVQAGFTVGVDCLSGIYFNNNILLFDDSVNTYIQQWVTSMIYNHVHSVYKIEMIEDTFVFCTIHGKIYVKIVNYNLLLTICNLICTVKKYISQRN